MLPLERKQRHKQPEAHPQRERRESLLAKKVLLLFSNPGNKGRGGHGVGKGAAGWGSGPCPKSQPSPYAADGMRSSKRHWGDHPVCPVIHDPQPWSTTTTTVTANGEGHGQRQRLRYIFKCKVCKDKGHKMSRHVQCGTKSARAAAKGMPESATKRRQRQPNACNAKVRACPEEFFHPRRRHAVREAEEGRLICPPVFRLPPEGAEANAWKCRIPRRSMCVVCEVKGARPAHAAAAKMLLSFAAAAAQMPVAANSAKRAKMRSLSVHTHHHHHATPATTGMVLSLLTSQELFPQKQPTPSPSPGTTHIVAPFPVKRLLHHAVTVVVVTASPSPPTTASNCPVCLFFQRVHVMHKANVYVCLPMCKALKFLLQM